MLPWVVEREYSGRLIYAGGDDALFMCPADDALALLGRLNELFTAPWVLDRHPDASTWVKDEPDDALYRVGEAGHRKRFEILNDTTSTDLRAQKGRVFPMLGPNSSFSAGAAFGHFKTPLRVLRAEAKALQAKAKLPDDVKRQRGRRAGLAWFTRSGPKVRAVAALEKTPGGVTDIHELAGAFEAGTLPARLPYKLRELAPLAKATAVLPDEDQKKTIRGLVKRSLEGDGARAETIADAWLAALKQTDRNDLGQDGLGFLLFARALSGQLPNDQKGAQHGN